MFILSLVMLRGALKKYRQQPIPEKDLVPEPSLAMKLTTSLIMALHIGYKLNGNGSRTKILYMMAPCNFLWLVYWAICYIPMTARARQIAYQITVPYLAFPTLAFIAPEEVNLTNWMERPFFYVHHALLVVLAFHLLRSRRVSMIPKSGDISYSILKEWVLAFSFFGIYHSALSVPLSIVFGVNLNYVMSPPNTHWSGGWFGGRWYRLQLVTYFGAEFLLIQLLIAIFELWIQRVTPPAKEDATKKYS